MNKNQVIETLKKECQSDPVTGAVLHAFALRKRARATVTVTALTQKMKKEGFKFNKDDYRRVLKFLAHLGFGKLANDRKGRVKALEGIQTSIQSIGAVACGDRMPLKTFRKRNRFNKVATALVTAKGEAEAPIEAPLEYPVSINVQVRGKKVTLALPKDLTANEITEILTKFRVAS